MADHAAFDHDGRALKVATRALVRSLGGIEGAAATLGKGKSTVARWADPQDADHWIGLRDLAALELHAPAPVVTQVLCRLAGGVLVPLAADGAESGALSERLISIMDHVGQLARHTGSAVADGQCSAAEAGPIRAALHELLITASLFDRQLEAIERGGRGMMWAAFAGALYLMGMVVMGVLLVLAAALGRAQQGLGMRGFDWAGLVLAVLAWPVTAWLLWRTERDVRGGR